MAIKTLQEIKDSIQKQIKEDNFFYVPPFIIQDSVLSFEIRGNFNIEEDIQLSYYDVLGKKQDLYFKTLEYTYKKIEELIAIM